MAKNNNDEFHLNLEMNPGFKAPSEESPRLHEAMQRALEEQSKQADS